MLHPRFKKILSFEPYAAMMLALRFKENLGWVLGLFPEGFD